MCIHDTIRRELHTPCAELHVRESGEGDASGRNIQGYAILFDTPSSPWYEEDGTEIREVIDPSAVTRELLDSSDIKFTLFHDRQLLLARSKQGKGTLSYDIDRKGVSFSFEAPRTADGDKAIELVRNGVIDGCSFMFSTKYRDKDHVEVTRVTKGDKTEITCRVKKILGIHDMTLTPDPAYPDTSAETRELGKSVAVDSVADNTPAGLDNYIKGMRDNGRMSRS